MRATPASTAATPACCTRRTCSPSTRRANRIVTTKDAPPNTLPIRIVPLSPLQVSRTWPLPVGNVPTPDHSSQLMLMLTEPEVGSSGRAVPSVSANVHAGSAPGRA